MSFRNKIILLLYKTFGKIRLLDFFVIHFYRNIIFPSVKTYLLERHPQLIDVQYRHSARSFKNFNAFLSDLDITLILADNSDSLPVLTSYFKLKKYLIMLDYPEVYEQKENDFLNSQNKYSELIELFWNIRKINWNLDSLREDRSELNRIKKNRSIEKSLQKILRVPNKLRPLVFTIEDFKHLDRLIPADSAEKNLLYWSFFLETTTPEHLQIKLTSRQFDFLNSLMPGEDLSPSIASHISSEFKLNKRALELHELLLSKSAIRLKRAQGQDVKRWTEWTQYLEKKLAVQS